MPQQTIEFLNFLTDRGFTNPHFHALRPDGKPIDIINHSGYMHGKTRMNKGTNTIIRQRLETLVERVQTHTGIPGDADYRRWITEIVAEDGEVAQPAQPRTQNTRRETDAPATECSDVTGIYIVCLTNDFPINIGAGNDAEATRENIKFGKAKNFENRRRNYEKTFSHGRKNYSRFFPIYAVPEVFLKKFENLVKNQIRHGDRLPGSREWLRGISREALLSAIHATADEFRLAGIECRYLNPQWNDDMA